MKKHILLVFLTLSLSVVYGQKRSMEHNVRFSNINGFDGYVVFETRYEGPATTMKAVNAKLYLKKYYKVESSELTALKEAGIDFGKGYVPKKFSFDVEGTVYIGHGLYPAAEKTRLGLSDALGDLTEVYFTESATAAKKKWESAHPGKSYWEETGSFKDVKVVELYLSDLEYEIERILRDFRMVNN